MKQMEKPVLIFSKTLANKWTLNLIQLPPGAKFQFVLDFRLKFL